MLLSQKLKGNCFFKEEILQSIKWEIQKKRWLDFNKNELSKEIKNFRKLHEKTEKILEIWIGPFYEK